MSKKPSKGLIKESFLLMSGTEGSTTRGGATESDFDGWYGKQEPKDLRGESRYTKNRLVK